MREEFEKLPEIAEMIKSGDVWWSEEHDNYVSSTFESSCYISGAWYAFQKQQKRIDEASNMISYMLLDCKNGVYPENNEIIKLMELLK